MGDGGAAIAGGIVGAIIGGGTGYKAGYTAGYNKRDSELQPLITQFQQQIQSKDQLLSQMAEELRSKNSKIADLEKDKGVPVLSTIRRRLGGVQS